MVEESETVTVSARIPKSMFETLQKIVRHSNYVGISDYIRDLIRKDLERRNPNNC